MMDALTVSIFHHALFVLLLWEKKLQTFQRLKCQRLKEEIRDRGWTEKIIDGRWNKAVIRENN